MPYPWYKTALHKEFQSGVERGLTFTVDPEVNDSELFLAQRVNICSLVNRIDNEFYSLFLRLRIIMSGPPEFYRNSEIQDK